MKQVTTTKNRKELENKMAIILKNNIESLPVKYRKILVDDLVTAFESRLCVLRRAPQSNLEFIAVTEEEVKIETQ
jgi:hypothetical protein